MSIYQLLTRKPIDLIIEFHWIMNFYSSLKLFLRISSYTEEKVFYIFYGITANVPQSMGNISQLALMCLSKKGEDI